MYLFLCKNNKLVMAHNARCRSWSPPISKPRVCRNEGVQRVRRLWKIGGGSGDLVVVVSQSVDPRQYSTQEVIYQEQEQGLGVYMFLCEGKGMGGKTEGGRESRARGMAECDFDMHLMGMKGCMERCMIWQEDRKHGRPTSVLLQGRVRPLIMFDARGWVCFFFLHLSF